MIINLFIIFKKENKVQIENNEKIKLNTIDFKEITDLVIIQENQLSQEDLIKWIAKQKQ